LHERRNSIVHNDKMDFSFIEKRVRFIEKIHRIISKEKKKYVIKNIIKNRHNRQRIYKSNINVKLVIVRYKNKF